MSETYPLFPSRTPQVLDGVWDFCWLGAGIEADAVEPAALAFDDLAAVPGVFDTAISRCNARGVGVYRRRVTCAAGLQRLTIGGLGLSGRVFWDGRPVGACRIPYAEFSLDIEATAGEHTLDILVDNRFTPGPALFHAYADFYGFGGVYRSVTLQTLPPRRVERAVVTTRDLATGRVHLALHLAGVPDGETAMRLGFDDAAPEVVRLPVKGGAAGIERTVPGFRVWSPEHPHLHTVAVTLDGDTVVERFGIRTVATRGQEILLNGRPVRLLGANRHESHPELGPVQPDHLAVDDIKILKELGCNFVRCVHYQPTPAFLDLCDRAGILVWAESVGWGNSEADARDPATAALAVEATERLVRRSINNPSVIIWAFLNESCSDCEAGRAWYRAIAAAIRALDGSRLVSYASNRIERDICFDVADVIAINAYPGWINDADDWHTGALPHVRPAVDRYAAWAGLEGRERKPLLMSEIGACALYGVHDHGRAQWSEEFQADFMGEAARAVLGNRRYAGLALWQLFDTRSYVNVGSVRTKPRGINSAGLLDEYRRPKLAFQVVRDIYRNPPPADCG